MSNLQPETRQPDHKTPGRKVDFIICGVQKGGTTALDAYFVGHPEICLAQKKELHFFDTEAFFESKQPDYSIYHSWFNLKAEHKVIGESTPIYMYWYDTPKRIWQYNPEMKLIVILRNPIDRAYSHWNMERSRNYDNLSFWDAIQNEPQRLRESLPYQHRIFSYIDRGFYLEQLRRLWFFFPKDQVLIIKNEHLRNQPKEALEDLTDFLGINKFENIENSKVNSLPYQSQMSHKEREYLQYVFEHEIHGLERILGWDCSDWLK